MEEYKTFRWKKYDVKSEVEEKYVETYSYLLKLKGSFLKDCFQLYAETIEDNWRTIAQMIDFIHCKKINTCRPDEHSFFYQLL